MSKYRFIGALFLLLLLAAPLLALSGCGDRELKQRRAFIAFLEQKVLVQKVVKLADLSRSEKKGFGDYAGQYELLVQFQKIMAKDMGKNARDLLALSSHKDLEAMAKAGRSIRKAVYEAEKVHKLVLDLKTETDAARAKFKQPADLIPVYDAAYGKIVTVPAQAAAATFEAIGAVFVATLDLLDFVDTHSRDMEIEGKNINVKNPSLLEDLKGKMAVVQEKAAALQEAHAAMARAMAQ